MKVELAMVKVGIVSSCLWCVWKRWLWKAAAVRERCGVDVSGEVEIN